MNRITDYLPPDPPPRPEPKPGPEQKSPLPLKVPAPPSCRPGHCWCPVDDPLAFAAYVGGKAMSPKYREGELVVFSPAAKVRAGDDCFVRLTDGSTTFRRYYYEKRDGVEVVRLEPRNRKEKPRVEPYARVASVAKAVFRFQWLGRGT